MIRLLLYWFVALLLCVYMCNFIQKNKVYWYMRICTWVELLRTCVLKCITEEKCLVLMVNKIFFQGSSSSWRRRIVSWALIVATFTLWAKVHLLMLSWPSFLGRKQDVAMVKMDLCICSLLNIIFLVGLLLSE